MSRSKINTIVIVMKLRQTSVPALLERVTSIVTAMETNKATFPGPTPPLATVKAALAALVSAQTALKNRTGSRADRDDKQKVVVAGAGALHAYVQQVTNVDPTNAEVIATQAAMTLRKQALRAKADLAAKQTVSGVVNLVAKATKGARINEWQYSTDGGKTWIDAPSTTKAKTAIHGLTPGVSVSYRQRVITKDGTGDWSQPISALVI
jgi:hypothetical protein